MGDLLGVAVVVLGFFLLVWMRRSRMPAIEKVSVVVLLGLFALSALIFVSFLNMGY
jgi:hypothetical protein